MSVDIDERLSDIESSDTARNDTARWDIPTEQSHPGSSALSNMGPDEIVRLMIEELDFKRPVLEPAAESIIELANRLSADGRIFYVAAGTPGRLANVDAAEIPPTSGLSDRVIAVNAGGIPALYSAVESREDDASGAVHVLRQHELTERDVLIGISASGTTPYVLGALEWASCQTQRPVTALIANRTMEKPTFADILVALDSGPEVLTGSTRLRAGTAQTNVLKIISTVFIVVCGRVHENYMIGCRGMDSSQKLERRSVRNIAAIAGISEARATELLSAAEGNQMIALLVQEFGVDTEKARRVLEAHNGHFGQARRALATYHVP